MASMGFTQESIKKLMNVLDDARSGMDEKTYVELSNAAKYLYDKVGNSGAVQTAPPPTPDVEYLYQVYDLTNDSDSDSGLGPGAVGRDINRRAPVNPQDSEDENDEGALAIIAAADWWENRRRAAAAARESMAQHPAVQRAVNQHNQQTAERINRPPTPVVRQQVNRLRLCNRHKITALIKLFISFNYVIPNKGGDCDTVYIERLYNILINTGSVSSTEIMRRYYIEKEADINARGNN